MGDAHGKLTLLRNVGWLRMIPPSLAVAVLAMDLPFTALLAGFAVLFFFAGAVIADLVPLTAVFAVAIAAAAVQHVLYARLAGWENS